MSSYTENYNLNQWEASDQVRRVDFNADNAKIDAALTNLSTQVAAKAEQTALNAEISARSNAVTSLNSQISALAAKVAKLGNCQILYMTYTGDNEPTRTFTFPHRPLVVFAMGDNLLVRAVQGTPYTLCHTNGEGGVNVPTTWEGNSMTWTSGANRDYGPNWLTSAYHMVVLMDASE